MKLTKKKIIVAGALVGALALGGTAIAYWTTTGAGTGSGTVAASNGTLTLSATFPNAALYPGGSQVVSFKATNGNATDLRLNTIHTVVTTSDPTNCLASWFSVADVSANQTIPAGATALAVTSTGIIAFANDAANQDACKSATLTLTLTSV